MEQEPINRMAIAITGGSQARDLINGLNREGFPATKIDAVGGFLHEAAITLLVGLPEAKLADFLALVRHYCPAHTRYVPMNVEMALAPSYPMMIEARIGGASVFILPVEQFLQI